MQKTGGFIRSPHKRMPALPAQGAKWDVPHLRLSRDLGRAGEEKPTGLEVDVKNVS